MKNHRHASCCFCARQTFIVVRKEVIFIHISRYTFCTRSCIFMAEGACDAYPLAIKDGETLFKPDTPLEIRFEKPKNVERSCVTPRPRFDG